MDITNIIRKRLGPESSFVFAKRSNISTGKVSSRLQADNTKTQSVVVSLKTTVNLAVEMLLWYLSTNDGSGARTFL